MQGIAEAIKYLYQQFILRDVVAYVSPRTILAACVLKVHLGSWKAAVAFINQDIPAVAFVPIYGFLFITGLAIQNLGEMLKLLPEHNRPNDKERFGALQRFYRATSAGHVTNERNDYGETLERVRERIEVKKYASGNIAAAMVISAILIGVTKIFPSSAPWAIISVGVILVASLIRAHRCQLNNVSIWEDEATQNHKEEKE